MTVHNSSLHRFAVFTVLATLGLVGMGGLVTSHGVGMAVPDWPTSYGYNMFALPISTWLTGGIFHEHTHRLWASEVGILTIVREKIAPRSYRSRNRAAPLRHRRNQSPQWTPIQPAHRDSWRDRAHRYFLLATVRTSEPPTARARRLGDRSGLVAGIARRFARGVGFATGGGRAIGNSVRHRSRLSGSRIFGFVGGDLIDDESVVAVFR